MLETDIFIGVCDTAQAPANVADKWIMTNQIGTVVITSGCTYSPHALVSSPRTNLTLNGQGTIHLALPNVSNSLGWTGDQRSWVAGILLGHPQDHPFPGKLSLNLNA